MGTRGPPQAPPRRLNALRRRHAVGIGAISADLAHAWSAEWHARSRAEQVDLRLSGSVARVSSAPTTGVQAGSGLPLGGFLFG
jgi:hypothetical protein